MLEDARSNSEDSRPPDDFSRIIVVEAENDDLTLVRLLGQLLRMIHLHNALLPRRCQRLKHILHVEFHLCKPLLIDILLLL